MPNKTILIAAGGTGGHLYPAIAVAEEIRSEYPDAKVIFVGTRDRIEAKEVPRAGFPFEPIDIHPPRRSLASMLMFPFKFCMAIVDCMSLISKEKPSAMLGAGAYLTVPVGIAAWLSRVPIALLEINSIPGSANKLLARFAKRVFLSYPESVSKFSNRIAGIATVCGTPVREGLGVERMSEQDARRGFGLDPTQKTVLVFGGSLGARAINEAMCNAAGTLAAQGYNILWQTGKSANIAKLEEQFMQMPNVRIADYIYNMEQAYRAADLVVCRAGASSLAELARLGKPAVLVPWSGAMDNHQEPNARAFERDGSAVVLTDAEVGSKLAETVLNLLSDPTRLRSMAEAIRRRDHPEAAKVVAAWLMSNA